VGWTADDIVYELLAAAATKHKNKTTKMKMLILFTSVLFVASATKTSKKLALTPPMGWMSWERFRCDVDCVAQPDGTFSF